MKFQLGQRRKGVNLMQWGGKCGDQGTEEEEDGLDERRGQDGERKVERGTRGSPDALRAAGWMAGYRINCDIEPIGHKTQVCFTVNRKPLEWKCLAES